MTLEPKGESVSSRPSNRLLIATALIASALGLGCAHPNAQTPAAASARPALAPTADLADLAAERERPQPSYRIQVGDRLRVAFAYEPHLDQDVAVRPDGRIALPLAGELRAAGRTPAELGAVLATRLEGALHRPEPTVIVHAAQPYQVFVGGGVRAPGAFALSPQLTALRAITAAGGARDPAALRSVMVVRQRPDGERILLRLDLDLGQGEDLPLRAGDLVLVSEPGRRTP